MLPLLFALLFVGGDAPVAIHTPPGCQGDSIVEKVSFENPAGLTFEQKASLNELLMARCFYRADGSSLSEAVYRQLRRLGYKSAYVQDPIVRVLDRSVHPLPVSVTIDFVLTTSDRAGRK